MINTHTTTLDTGLPLVRLNMDGTRSVTVLVAFDAGARTERPECSRAARSTRPTAT
jgi:predicted Zn-dependent peptidase